MPFEDLKIFPFVVFNSINCEWLLLIHCKDESDGILTIFINLWLILLPISIAFLNPDFIQIERQTIMESSSMFNTTPAERNFFLSAALAKKSWDWLILCTHLG